MDELETYFKGLSDLTRLRIMNLLLQGELCVCDIQRILQGSQPTVSRHLTYLKHSGLVLDRRDGLRVFYRIPKQGQDLKQLRQFLRKVFKGKPILASDLEELKRALARGACAVPTPARPGGYVPHEFINWRAALTSR